MSCTFQLKDEDSQTGVGEGQGSDAYKSHTFRCSRLPTPGLRPVRHQESFDYEAVVWNQDHSGHWSQRRVLWISVTPS